MNATTMNVGDINNGYYVVKGVAVNIAPTLSDMVNQLILWVSACIWSQE